MIPENPYSNFSPRDYLLFFYRDIPQVNELHISDDEVVIFQFLKNFLRGKNFDAMLEAGCGPTIHNASPFTNHVNEIHLADYVPDNLLEIQQWLNESESAFNWDEYIKASIKIANETTDTTELRKKKLREKITSLKHLDLSQKYPLGEEVQYSLVTSFYCAECATESKIIWREYMENLFNLVSPGGTIIFVAIKNAKEYRVGKNIFPSANINEYDVADLLHSTNFNNIQIQTATFTGWEEEGFTEIILTSAEKSVA